MAKSKVATPALETSLGKALDLCYRAGKGRRHSDVFYDWCAVAEAALRMEPVHLASLRIEGKLAEDPPEIKELWARIERYYGKEIFPLFKDALQILVRQTQGLPPKDWTDLLGPLYMEIGANKDAGQFFTPMSVARMMAMMNVDGGIIYQRIAQTLGPDFDYSDHPTMWQRLEDRMLAYQVMTNGLGERREEIGVSADTPVFPVVTVCDPAVGAGVMLIAAASQFPRWAVEMGMVQFYGMDIDRDCVNMTKLNLMLYGCNGYGMNLKSMLGTWDYPSDDEVDWPLLEAAVRELREGGIKEVVRRVQQLVTAEPIAALAEEHVAVVHKPAVTVEKKGGAVQMGFDFTL
jgi:hypothetical protein